MARLLRYLDDELYVQYGGLCLYGGPDYPEFRDDESEALHYTATLHLEAWDAEPADPGCTTIMCLARALQSGLWVGGPGSVSVGSSSRRGGRTWGTARSW